MTHTNPTIAENPLDALIFGPLNADGNKAILDQIRADIADGRLPFTESADGRISNPDDPAVYQEA